MQVAARSWVLTDLLWNTLEEVSANDWLVGRLRFNSPWSVFHDWLKQVATALLIDKPTVFLVRISRAKIFAHFMLPRWILAWRRIFAACWVLKGWLRHIPVQKWRALLNWVKLSVNRSFNNVLWFLGVGIIVLRSWVIDRVEVSVWLPAIGAWVEHGFGPWTSLHLSKVFNQSSLLQRRALYRFGHLLNRWGRPIKEANFLEVGLHSLLLAWIYFWALWNELKRWWFILSNVNFDFVVARSKWQFLLSAKNVILFFLFVHLFYVYLH